jgi:general secretion pathway protein I
VSARRAARAFTLLEVMVALAILAGGLLAISQIVSASLRNEVRAQRLDVATLLARGKMVELEERYERTGFKDFDDSEDGDFDEEGHAEVKWRTEVLRPQGDLTSQRLMKVLTGTDDLNALVAGHVQSTGTASQKGGPETVNPMAGLIGPALDAQLVAFGEVVKKGLREVHLTVSWKDGKHEESFSVITHLLVLAPRGLP